MQSLHFPRYKDVFFAHNIIFQSTKLLLTFVKIKNTS